MVRIIVAAVFVGFFILNIFQERGFKTRGLETMGRKPVDGRLFAAGKFSTLLAWLAAFLQACGFNMRIVAVPRQLEYLAAALFLAVSPYSGPLTATWATPTPPGCQKNPRS